MKIQEGWREGTVVQKRKFTPLKLMPCNLLFLADKLSPECQAFLFQAVSSWGGSGWGRLLALLVPDEPNRVLRNLLPDVVVSNQGESRFWDEPTFSPYRLLTVADVVGDGDEAHFTEHLYKIRTYAYREDRGSFLLIDEYKTSKKYAILDETDK